MKRTLPVVLRSLLLAVILFSFSGKSFASHIVGGDIYYTSLGGLTYKITVVLYGDCGPASSGAFAGLPTAHPEVCIYDGATLWSSRALGIRPPSAGTEITPVCPDSISRTQCTNPSFAIPGIKKFVYDTIVVLPNTSTNWRFVFDAALGASGTAGRAAAITNIVGPGGTSIQLEATLNNTVFTNTSPNLTVVPTPFFCINNPICYTPGAVDPESDSLRFDLITATNASTSCGTPGTPVTYTGTAYGTTPVSPTTPLRCATGSYNFNTVNGQVCFNPNFLQRAIVVYNISEYRSGQLVGTCQREMTFLVQDCPVQPPSADTGVIGGVIVRDGATSFHVCGNAGNFTITLNPRPDPGPVPPLNLTAAITGLPTGVTPTFLNNGTPTPTIILNGNATLMAPGVYTFFLRLKDNACPINGDKTIAYTISIYPVPAISAVITTPLQCISKAVITATPGGQGNPWTIKVIDSALSPPLDTVASYTTSVPITDLRDPGKYYYVIYTNVTTQCSLIDSVRVVAPPKLVPVPTPIDPSYCGKNDGKIILGNLNVGGIDTITYDRYGTAQPPLVLVVSAAGEVTIPNLRSGVYSNIVVHYGYCTSLPIGPITLTDPPFTVRASSFKDPSKCGFCDGYIKLYGIHPDQLDTVTFNKDGISQPAISFYVTGDSTIKLPGLCSGSYTTFKVQTAGNCVFTLLDVDVLTNPLMPINFDYVIKYGCKADTLITTNKSAPPSDLTYQWQFGDGGTATSINPTHVYTNTVGSTYTVKLFGTNTQCLDSAKTTFTLDHFVKAGFTQDPAEIVCQIDPVKFTNTSTGTTPDYQWLFGGGNTGNTTDITHVYANMGTYNTILVAHTNAMGINCYDTAIRSIIVDSNSILTLKVSGDVTAICRGQAVTLSAIYTTSGATENGWSMGDGFSMANMNPIMHSFEGVGPFTVNFNAKFRACPEKKSSLKITVFDVPGLYLGPDTAICPGSSPITLTDDRYNGSLKARWHWNTDDNNKSSQLVVTKPGMYAATVTIDGCSISDTVYVRKDCYVDVPNVFTPNGDGVNDFFFPRGLLTKGLVTFKMTIYNRWGQVIYETSKIEGQGWDGAASGVPQPSGVYIYSIDATFKDGMIEQHKGNVTLLK